MKIIQYDHHWGDRTVTVSVIEANKGKHKENCLCFQGCKFFKPQTSENCELAQGNYEYCVKHDLVLPVWECPKYEKNEIER